LPPCINSVFVRGEFVKVNLTFDEASGRKPLGDQGQGKIESAAVLYNEASAPQCLEIIVRRCEVSRRDWLAFHVSYQHGQSA